MTAARRDGLVLAATLLLAAVLRLVGLPGRGEWDDDQGNELITLLHWVRDGEVPLLGPLSSVGTAHHGVAYYWILAPSAFVSDGHPVAAVATVALIGIAGVAATWWLGRTVAGPLAGHVAALLITVSPSAISASTFLWNANIVGPAAALATASSWHAWRTRRPRWWLLAAGATVLVVHGHMLAVVAAPPLVALIIADLLRRDSSQRRQLIWPIVGASAIVTAASIPLLIYEMRNDFPETRAIVDYIAMGVGGVHKLTDLPVIAWRILAWPLSSDIGSAPLSGLPTVFVTVAALTIAATGTSGIARQFGRWAVATTIWAIGALTVIAPSLGDIHPGLPRDQYHSWLDPIVFAAIGVAVAWMWSARANLVRAAAAAMLVACVTLSLLSMPSFASSDSGWPRAAEAANGIRAVTGDDPTAVVGVYKSGAALEFPLRRQRSTIVDPSAAKFLVVTCDPLFERSVGVPCGGAAEAARAYMAGFPPAAAACFADGPRRSVCVFSRS